MVGAQLDLAGKVEEHVCIGAQLVEAVMKPVKVGFQVFHAVKHAAIGTKLVLLHNIGERYQ